MKCFTLGDLDLSTITRVAADPEILGRNLNGGVYVVMGQGAKTTSVLARSMGTQGFVTHKIADVYAIREASLYENGDDLVLIPPSPTDVLPQVLVALTFKSGYGGYVKPGVWLTDGGKVITQIIYKHYSSLNDAFEGEVLECLLVLPNNGFAHVYVLDGTSRNWRYTVHFMDGKGITATVAKC